MSSERETSPAWRSLSGFLVLAALLAGGFAVLHALGLRDHTSVLSGTYPAGGGSALGGALYALAWFGLVLGAPIALLWGAIYTVLVRVTARPRPPSPR